MTQEEILQYNKRCAEFLGKEYNDNRIVTPYTHFSGQNPTGKIWEECKFHLDWNWIMEVILAINMVPNPKNPSDTTLQTKRTNVQSILRSAKKEAVVQAINQFLIWYEQNKTI